MTEKRESGLGKNAFGQVDQKTICLENVKNGGEMGKVRGKIGTGHQNVVEIDKHKRKTTEEMVHEPLESLSSIAEAKRHFGEFKKTERGDAVSCRRRPRSFPARRKAGGSCEPRRQTARDSNRCRPPVPWSPRPAAG